MDSEITILKFVKFQYTTLYNYNIQLCTKTLLRPRAHAATVRVRPDVASRVHQRSRAESLRGRARRAELRADGNAPFTWTISRMDDTIVEKP